MTKTAFVGTSQWLQLVYVYVCTLMKDNKPETALCRAPTFPLLESRGGFSSFVVMLHKLCR